MESEPPCAEAEQQRYASHFKCILDLVMKRKITPWLLEKALQQQLGGKPKNIRSTNRESFVIEVNNKEQSEAIMKIVTINNTPVNITQDSTFSTSKGLINIYNYDLTDFDNFKLLLK